MIHVSFDLDAMEPEEREWFEAWSLRADEAQARTIASFRPGDKPQFDEEVWAELRRWLFRHVFNRKCAYCEGSVTPQSWGAAEHWRPKGGVSVRRDGRREVISRDGVPHPGYYWLAYDWHNLLPACDRCNSGKGKGTQFPIEGKYAFSPAEGATRAELDARERPLLLHAFDSGDRDPRLHIEFDEFGIPHPRRTASGERSRYGDETIKVFDLDREDLNDERRQLYEDLETTVPDAVAKAAQGWEPLPDLVAPLSNPRKTYSLAAECFAWMHVKRTVAGLAAQIP